MNGNGTILLVDDNEDDVLIIRKALKEANVNNDTIHKKNGREALDFLLDEVIEMPRLILLDLKMPKMTGNEFLKERMRHDALMTVPVIVLTAIHNEGSKQESFGMNIAGYMQKPSEYNSMVDVMKAIDNYWSFSEMVQHD